MNKRIVVFIVFALVLILLFIAFIIVSISRSQRIYEKLCKYEYCGEDDDYSVTISKNPKEEYPIITISKKSEQEEYQFYIYANKPGNAYKQSFEIIDIANESNQNKITVTMWFDNRATILFEVKSENKLDYMDGKKIVVRQGKTGVGSMS